MILSFLATASAALKIWIPSAPSTAIVSGENERTYDRPSMEQFEWKKRKINK